MNNKLKYFLAALFTAGLITAGALCIPKMVEAQTAARENVRVLDCK